MEAHPLFSWIHLSDIHVGHGDATHVEDQKLVLGALRSDVQQMLASGMPRPDAIFVTGDIAFSGASRHDDEYTRATEWLTAIAKTAGLGLDAVFAVPGNHDVQRSADKPMAAAALLRELRAGRSSLDAALEDSDACAQLRKRQANYLMFAANLAPACRTNAEVPGAQLYWRHALKARDGLSVRIVGLNTALLAADEAIFEADQGRLWLGTRQLSAAFTEPEAADSEVVVMLSHHPLHDRWLSDETEAARWIRKHAHVHLSGHVHEASSERARGGGGTDFVSIAAGAAHGEKTPHGYPARHGYSFGALVASHGALKVRVWPRMWSDVNKDFRLDVDNVPKDAKYSEHDLPRVLLAKPDAPDSLPELPGNRSGGVSTPTTVQLAAISIARLPSGTSQFVGRKDELTTLDQAWSSQGIHVLTLVAWGGTGKSTLVAEWLVRMAQAKWRGATKVFGWSFYSQGARDNGTDSADLFVNQALEFFGDKDPTKGSAWERGERLAVLVRKERTLLVLDGLEPLQEPESSGGRLRDQALTSLLRELAASMNGLCIVTTRQPVGEIAEFVGKMAVRIDLDQLSEQDGAELLRLCSVNGSQEELREVSRAVQGHALTMTLLGNYIADALDSDVRRWREVPLGATETRPGERARHVMEAYDRWFGPGPGRAILRIIGLFDRPASAECIAALRREPAIAGVTDTLIALTDMKWKLAVNHLRRTGLLASTGKSDDGSLDAHPLVRECFGTMLERENPEGFRAAHWRLYEHLRDTTPKLPDTFDEMQPLFQAVWHGCKAGKYQEALDQVFYLRIRRGGQHYSVNMLGAVEADLATLMGFFEGGLTQPVASLTEARQSSLLSEVAYGLRTLGRLREAAAPMKSALEMKITLSDWSNAANAASNLAQLHAVSGALHEALSMAKRSVELADRAGKDKWRWRVLSRCTLANIFRHLGNRENARLLFEEAEQMQVKEQPQFPFLYSYQGSQFCELLLELGEALEVERRTSQTLVWMEQQHWISDIARDHLLLGRALETLEKWEDARPHFALAIDGLRTARKLEFLASALVIRSAFLHKTGDHEAARRDLDEALGLARRSELRLVECDACLEQARFALDMNDSASARAPFEIAHSLVNECEYHRRDCELALLEARLALADGNRIAARTAYERARAVATAEKLRACDKELAEVAAAVA